MMPALEFRRSPLRYLTLRSTTATRLGGRYSGTLASNMAPLRLTSRAEPKPPGDGWLRLRPLLSGICGSDIGMLTGRSSPYLTPVVSMPFVPGHEVVAEVLDGAPGFPKGCRVVVDPVLSCTARGVAPCRWCAAGRHSRCDRVTTGRISAGLQTGFCTDTGGGWSRAMVSHHSQLHRVPDDLPDERCVLVEPLACAIHSVRRIVVDPGASVLIVGAGTVGLLTLLALREFTAAGPIYVIAKHASQRERARAIGATETLEPQRAARAVRRVTGGSLEKPVLGPEYLLGGTDVVFECTGGTGGLDMALRLVRAAGTVVLSGMPTGSVDLTPVWFRELHLVGSYASDAGGSAADADDPAPDPRTEYFVAAIALAGEAPLGGYVDAVYPLTRWREAIAHASAAGRLGAVKVAFDPSRD